MSAPSATTLRRALGPALTVLVAIVAFAAVIPGGKFVFDDHVLIEKNIDLLRGDVWWASFGRDYYATSERRGDSGYYRPVAVLTNAIDLRLWRAKHSGYHMTNLALHAAASAALAPALVTLGAPATVAWVTAVFFAAHPVHAESVAFVSGRVDVLAALGCFVALALVGARRRFATLGVGLASFFAFLSKESSVVLPLLVLLAWMAQRDRRRQEDAGDAPAEAPPTGLGLLVAVGVAALVALLLRYAALGAWLPASASEQRSGTTWLLPLQTLLFAAASLYAPLQKLVLEPDPAHLSAVRLVAGALVGAALWVGAGRVDRAAHPYLRRCLVAGAIAIVPVLNFLPQETALSERYFYLASGFLLVPVGVLLVTGWRRGGALQPAIVGAGAVALLLLGGISAWRARAWRDDVVLWRLAVREEPNRAAFWDRLGLALTERKEFDPAEGALRRAVELDPTYFNAQVNLGAMLQASRRAHAAIPVYRHALELQPRHVNTHLNLGMALLDEGDLPAAYQEFKTAAAIMPDNPDAQRLLGGAALQMGKLGEARTALEAARRLVPSHTGVAQAFKLLEELEQRRAAPTQTPPPTPPPTTTPSPAR